IRFDLVRLSCDELRRLAEIRGGEVELADRDVAVATMAIEPRLIRVALDGARVHVDRVAEPSKVGETAAQPDRGVGGRRVAIVFGLRFCEVGLEAGLRVAGRRRRDERLAKKRRR